MDLTTISKYSVEKKNKVNGRWPEVIWAWNLVLYTHEILGGGRMEFELQENDEQFISQLTAILIANNAEIIDNNDTSSNIKVNEEQELNLQKYIERKDILFSSHLFLYDSSQTPYFCIMRNTPKIEIYEDFASAVVNEQIKCLDISLFSDVRPFMNDGKYGLTLVSKETEIEEIFLSDCPLKHGLQKLNIEENASTNGKCNECYHALSLNSFTCEMCNYNICNNCMISSANVNLLSMYDNDRHEWLLHLQFILYFQMMPAKFYTEKLNANEIQSILDSTKNVNNNQMDEEIDDDNNSEKIEKEEIGNDIILDFILRSLDMKHEEIVHAISKDSQLTDIEKLLVVDRVFQSWMTTNKVFHCF